MHLVRVPFLCSRDFQKQSGACQAGGLVYEWRAGILGRIGDPAAFIEEGIKVDARVL